MRLVVIGESDCGNQLGRDKRYYPGADELRLRITGDTRTGRLLGAQIAGNWKAEIAKRIDIFGTALFHRMTVEEINALDLSYTPPLGSPWDAVQIAAQTWTSSQRYYDQGE